MLLNSSKSSKKQNATKSVAKVMALVICVVTCFNFGFREVKADISNDKDNYFTDNGGGDFNLALTEGQEVTKQEGLHEINLNWIVPEPYANVDIDYQIMHEVDGVEKNSTSQ
jgi:hypothetical protein